jgi:hypothetical protein
MNRQRGQLLALANRSFRFCFHYRLLQGIDLLYISIYRAFHINHIIIILYKYAMQRDHAQRRPHWEGYVACHYSL